MADRHVALAGALALALASGVGAQDRRDVLVGGDPSADACASSLRVAIQDEPGNFLAVRSAPGRGASMVDRLPARAVVLACDEDGEWVGVVYGTEGESCGLSEPEGTRHPYRGPCRSGWAHRDFLTGEAG